MNRTELIKNIIKKFNYQSYLEIGCANDWNFNQINVPTKIGVDPGQGGTHRMTSDDFFKQNTQKFDIIFIDGLHISEQVDKDIVNALTCLNENGTIVMHDCNPAVEEAQRTYVVISDWNGDVWKSFVKQRSNPNLDMATGNFDHGCGIIRVRKNSQPLAPVKEGLYNWHDLVRNRPEWMRLMNFNDLLKWI